MTRRLRGMVLGTTQPLFRMLELSLRSAFIPELVELSSATVDGRDGMLVRGLSCLKSV